MATPSHPSLASSRSKAHGLVLAGGILFVLGFGAPGALLGTLAGPGTQSAEVQAPRQA